MSFYSTDEYLANEARNSRRQLRERRAATPSRAAHPPEHVRAQMQNILDSIPETLARPNAFAIQAAAQERERLARRERSMTEHSRLDQMSAAGQYREMLEHNPTYLAEARRRHVTPPTDVHPALRGAGIGDLEEMPRDSTVTNITDFMQAGLEEKMEEKTKEKLKLKATPDPGSVPTFRGRIEESDGVTGGEEDGQEKVTVPVFHPTPKLPTTEGFPQRPGTPADGLRKDASASKLPIKTPKKGIFSKFKFSASSRAPDPKDEDTAQTQLQVEDRVPVKAQAVLGESPMKPKKRLSLGGMPSPTKIPRTPSKRKGFFSRKNADDTESSATSQRPSTTLSEGHQRPPHPPSSTFSDGIYTATSAPAHYSSYQGHKRVGSKNSVAETQFSGYQGHKRTESINSSGDMKKPSQPIVQGMGRSHSMKLVDYSPVPPTPPAKNTPPAVRAARDADALSEMQDAMKLSAEGKKRIIGVSGDDDNKPTKIGNYGYRAAPTLVTKPSVWSMHASVVPDLMEPSALEEMHARVGALDLEGFSTPGENLRRSHIASAVYSPSVYSMEWAADREHTMANHTPMVGVAEKEEGLGTPSAHTKGSSSNGTIPIVYPDLASDPSYKKNAGTPLRRNDGAIDGSPTARGRASHLSPQLTVHNRTHSRDHLIDDCSEDGRQNLFALPITRSPAVKKESPRPSYHQASRSLGVYDSPGAFSHTSAMPSPLQCLPATTYTPRRRKERATSKGEVAGAENGVHNGLFPVVSADEVAAMRDGQRQRQQKPERMASGLGIEAGSAADAKAISGPMGNIFDTEPLLSPTIADNPVEKFSGRVTCENNNNNHTTDPEKPTLPSDPDKLDQIIKTLAHLQASSSDARQTDRIAHILSVLEARHGDLTSFRDEMRASNARLDERLAAMEGRRGGGGTSPPLTPSSAVVLGVSQMLNGAGSNEEALSVPRKRGADTRVSTDTAHDFYRDGIAASQTGDTETRTQTSGPSEVAASVTSSSGTNESETLRELRETNRRLMDMVGGFAEKIQRLEEQMKAGSEGAGSG